jgi:hypothetical protein
MFFLALTIVFDLVLTARTSVLNESVCAWLPTPTAPVTDQEYERSSGMQVVIGINERYSTSRFSFGEPSEMMSLTNVELGPRGLFTRQVRFPIFLCCYYVYKDVLTSRVFCRMSALIQDINLSAQVLSLVVLLQTLFVSLFSLSWIYNGSLKCITL